METKYFITGASGPFATGVIEGLIASGINPQNLNLMSRSPKKLEKYANLGAKTFYGDFNKPETVLEAAKGAQIMLMISAHEVGFRIPQHANAIEAAKKSGIQHIVYTSYYGSDADNTALVCQDHHGTENLLKASGLKYTIMRDGFYMDTIFNACIPNSLKSGEWVTCSNGGKLSLASREDCFACALEVLKNPSQHENITYNITGTDTWSFQDMCDVAEEITGKKIKIINLDDQSFIDYWKSFGIPMDAHEQFNLGGFEWCIEDMLSYERECRKGSFAIVSQDMKKLLGREPKNLREILWDNADKFRQAAA